MMNNHVPTRIFTSGLTVWLYAVPFRGIVVNSLMLISNLRFELNED